MKKRKLFLYVLFSINIYLLSVPTIVSASTRPTSITNFNESISPLADDITWEYRTINGVLYKRLYNYTTDTPLSDWMPVT